MGINYKHKQQSISFKVLSNENPKAMYNFFRKKWNKSDFFLLPISKLTHLGFTKENIRTFRKEYNNTADRERQLAEENGVEIIFRENKYFPLLLKEIYDPPEFLYVKGDKEVLNSRMLAVVGSRKGSEYGRRTISRLIPEISGARVTIVSGMAYGIDSMSHMEAVKNNGKTIGVNAGGLLSIYPSGNSSLIKKILANGCIVSEFPLNMEPRPHLFPIRNRIIAGMSEAILVVEAEIRSGSLITARLGLEQDRDILAVPGNIDSPISTGTNHLIQQGAKLITSAEDILIEYGIKIKKERKVLSMQLTPPEKKILDLMSKNEVNSINYFVENTGNSVSQTISVLMGMVLKNLITEEDGGFKEIT